MDARNACICRSMVAHRLPYASLRHCYSYHVCCRQALSRLPETSACIGHPLILPYIEALYQQDIRRMAEDVPVDMCVRVMSLPLVCHCGAPCHPGSAPVSTSSSNIPIPTHTPSPSKPYQQHAKQR